MKSETNYIRDIERAAKTTVEVPHLVYLQNPLVAAAFDGGDNFSTTAKTVIDLSAVFGTPANIKEVNIKLGLMDSGSAGGADCYIVLGPTNTAGEGLSWRIRGWTNSIVYYTNMQVPCDSNGDIYYQTVATGANTMRIILQIWGYVQ